MNLKTLGLATGAAGLMIGALSLPAFAGAEDPFQPAAAYDSAAPEATSLGTGKNTVSDQNGASGYGWEMVLPPAGARGMAPSVGLSYSSEGPLRGTAFVGWSLDVGMPTIDRDFSVGAGVEAYSIGGQKLVAVTGDISLLGGIPYRTEFEDGSFRRIERLARNHGGPQGGWMVQDQNGVVHYYADDIYSSDLKTRWNITSSTAWNGNSIEYKWSRVDAQSGGRYADFRLNSIEYGKNAAANLQHHARVEFAYELDTECPGTNIPRGSTVDRKGGLSRMHGAYRLASISTKVRDAAGMDWRIVRKATLGHDTDAIACGGAQAPLRFLKSVNVLGYPKTGPGRAGNAQAAPPITFTYGPSHQLHEAMADVDDVAYFEQGDTALGSTSILQDFDGDGLQDLIRSGVGNSSPPGGVGEGQCYFAIRAGLAGGGFETTAHVVPLPTLSWSTGRWQDGHTPAGPTERCTVYGQYALSRPTVVDLGQTDGSGRCVLGGDGNVLSYHLTDWNGDKRPELLANAWTDGRYRAWLDLGLPSDAGALCNLDDHNRGAPDETRGLPECPGGTMPAPRSPERYGCLPHQYLWRVYSNTGSGFAGVPGADDAISANGAAGPAIDANGRPNLSFPQPLLVKSPRYMPPGAFTEGETAPMAQTGLPTTVDMDGDGNLDVINLGVKFTPAALFRFNEATQLFVWYGDGTGHFADDADAWSLSDAPQQDIPPRVKLGDFGWVDATRYTAGATATMADLNGDGLSDLVFQSKDDGRLQVFWNTGSGFTVPERLGTTGTVGSWSASMSKVYAWFFTNTILRDGWRASTVVAADVDGDGLVDRLMIPGDNVKVAQVYFNLGNGFSSTAHHLPNSWLRAARKFIAQNRSWHTSSDFADITGNGLPDLVEFVSATKLNILGHPTKQTPPFKLESIDNGRGLKLQFSYAPSTDSSVVEGQAFGSELYTGAPRWVVRSVTTDPGFGQPSITTDYRYANPRFGAPSGGNDEQFLGFETVTTLNPSPNRGATTGGKTVTHYDYGFASGSSLANDHRGHVTQTESYADATDDASLLSTSTTEWVTQSLFGDAVTFSHSTQTLTRTCSSSIADCRHQSENVLRSDSTWKPWSANGNVLLYVQDTSITGAGLFPAVGDRKTVTTHQVRYGQTPYPAGKYRVLVQMEESQEKRDSGFVATGRTVWKLDNTTGLATSVDSYPSPTRTATTRNTFDNATGLLVARMKPEQGPGGLSASQAVERYTYDDQKLFVATTTNELGHQVTNTVDVGTGNTEQVAGPNTRFAYDASCNCYTAVPEISAWTYDGFGREATRSVSVDTFKIWLMTYTVEVVHWTYYNDLLNQVRTFQLQDYDSNVWIEERAFTDGMGRPIETTQINPDGVDPKKQYAYDGAGNLRVLRVTNPAVDTGELVDYIYTYDGAARPVLFDPPDGATISVAYDGLKKTVRQLATDGSGSTRTGVSDMFGNLIEVHEFDDARGTTAPAITSYGYDSNDRLERVIDSEGTTSLLSHDWAGNRTHVQRGGRSWDYEYDRNGNLLSDHPPAPSASLSYTNRFKYDDLDRVTVKTVGSKNRSSTEMKRLGIGDIQYLYDAGDNAKGRLNRIEYSAWGSQSFAYQAGGLVTRQFQTIKVDKVPGHSVAPWSVQDAVFHRYNAMAQVKTTTHQTLGVGGGLDLWRNVYDGRGLVDKVEWCNAVWCTDTSTSWKSVADYTRSVSGQPRTRGSDFNQSRTWLYDVLGRPYFEFIKSGSALRGWRWYGFNQAGNVSSIAGGTGKLNATSRFTYDTRHRLVSASGPAGYTGAFTYDRAGNVTTAQVKYPNHQRAVSYEYGDRDPQAVDRLVHLGTEQPYAEFLYDLAGNTTSRTVNGAAWAMEWDVDDQLVEATGPSGYDEIYYYDDSHNRVAALSAGSDGVRTWFGDRETQYSHSGAEQKRMIHLSDGGGTLARVDVVGGVATVELQYSDALHNLILSQDALGQPKASFVYGAFGEVVATEGDAADHRRRFNGKEDDSTGLRYYGYRYYDPVSLRWNAGDPLYRFAPEVGINSPQEQNIYTFSMNNPLRFYDPDGRAVAVVLAACVAAPEVCVVGAAILAKVAYEMAKHADEMSKNSERAARSLGRAVVAVGGAVGDVHTSLVNLAVSTPTDSKPGDNPDRDKANEQNAEAAAADDAAGGVKPKAGSADASTGGKPFSQKVKEKARAESGDTCVFCGTKTTDKPGPSRSEIDHAVPKSRGGDNTIDNAQNTCRTCNRTKRARTTNEFIE